MSFRLPKVTFLITALACIALRIYLKLFDISQITGYYSRSSIVPIIFNGLLVVSLLVILISSLLHRAGEKRIRYSVLWRFSSILTGLAALAMAAVWIMQYKEDAYYFELPQKLDALVMIILAFPSALVYLFMGIALKEPAEKRRFNPFLPLIPIIWQVYLLLSMFMRYTATRHMSDQMLVILMLILLTPFMLAQGRMMGGLSLQKTANHTVGFGLCFSLVALTYSIATIIAIITQVDHGYAFNLTESIFYLLLGFNAALFALSVRKI